MSPIPSGVYALEHEPFDEAAPAVVLVHGTMDRSASFGRVISFLGDLHVVVFDRRGYGRSAAAGPAVNGLEDHVEDLAMVLDGRTATVVGHSYGGDVALLAAIRHPQLVSAVGVFESPMPWLEWWPPGSAGMEISRTSEPANAAEAFIRRVAGDRAWEDLPAATQADRRSEGPALLADIASISPPSAPFEPRECPVPVIVGSGTESRDYQREGAQRLAQYLGTELVTLAGGGHQSHTTHPKEFAGFVRRAVELAAPAARG